MRLRRCGRVARTRAAASRTASRRSRSRSRRRPPAIGCRARADRLERRRGGRVVVNARRGRAPPRCLRRALLAFGFGGVGGGGALLAGAAVLGLRGRRFVLVLVGRGALAAAGLVCSSERCSTSIRLTTLVAAGRSTLGASTVSPFARASIIAITSSRYLSWNFSGSNFSALIVSISILATFFSASATFSLSAGKSKRRPDDLVGEVHQFEHQRFAVGLERGEMFARADHDARDGDLVASLSASRSSA